MIKERIRKNFQEKLLEQIRQYDKEIRELERLLDKARECLLLCKKLYALETENQVRQNEGLEGELEKSIVRSKRKRKSARKELLEKKYGLSIPKILHHLYWTKQKTWEEIASEFKVTQITVEKWAEESGIEFRSYAHSILLRSKTKVEIEREYGQPLNKVLFYLMLQRAVKPLSNKVILERPITKSRLSEKHTATAVRRKKREKVKLPRMCTLLPQRKYVHRKVELAPTEGTSKCHNCLEEITLSKDGLDKDYRGATRADKWIFWHLPGQCPKDSNTHADLYRKELLRARQKEKIK